MTLHGWETCPGAGRPAPGIGRLGLAVALALVAGCRTTVEQELPGIENAVATEALAQGAWLVRSGERDLGSVVRLEDQRQARFFYSVSNVHGQELGLVDAEGRAWRHRPFQEQPEWVGTGTLEAGVGRILGGTGAVQLVPIPASELRRRLTSPPEGD